MTGAARSSCLLKNNIQVVTHIYIKIHNYNSKWLLVHNTDITPPTCFDPLLGHLQGVNINLKHKIKENRAITLFFFVLSLLYNNDHTI